MLRSDRLTSAVRGRKKPLLYVGAALALAGAGSASAATVGGSSTATPAAAAVAAPARHAATAADQVARSHRGAPSHQTAPGHTVTRGRQAAANGRGRRPQGQVHPARIVAWYQAVDVLNAQTNPVAARHHQLPMADRLTPVGISGPQAWMPMSAATVDNATTIVRQALDKRMGLRSAVIAVATAMQESGLLNLNYGTSDSLGLFQQRPSCGWGTAAQVTNPAYAARAFLDALRVHQANDPTWASQPLWANAQSVQNSGFPYAYAKWEAQSAHLVAGIAFNLVKSA